MNYNTGCPATRKKPTNCPSYFPCNCDNPPTPCYGVTCHANAVCKASAVTRDAYGVPISECVCNGGYYKVVQVPRAAKGVVTHDENKADTVQHGICRRASPKCKKDADCGPLPFGHG